MRVLILTNPAYRDFIAQNSLGDVVSYFGEDKFDFDSAGDYDIGISFMYQCKVPAKEIQSHRWFNFHPAPLPEYKGRDLCYHAIMNGEKQFGATLHFMDEGFDTGDIIETMKFSIFDDYTAEEVSRMTIEMSKMLFVEYFPMIVQGYDFSYAKNTGGTYYKKGQIIDEIPIEPNSPFGQFVRAVSYKDFHPRIDISGVKYKIVREK